MRGAKGVDTAGNRPPATPTSQPHSPLPRFAVSCSSYPSSHASCSHAQRSVTPWPRHSFLGCSRPEAPKRKMLIRHPSASGSQCCRSCTVRHTPAPLAHSLRLPRCPPHPARRWRPTSVPKTTRRHRLQSAKPPTSECTADKSGRQLESTKYLEAGPFAALVDRRSHTSSTPLASTVNVSLEPPSWA